MKGGTRKSGPPLAAACERLSTGELQVVGRLPWSSNLTFLVSIDEDPERSTDAEPSDGQLFGVYKPGNGERSLWDFPDGLYRREVAAYELSVALGWDIVPPTVLRDDAPLGPGSVQLFVDADYERHYFTLFEEGEHDGLLQAVCAFDVAANNADRKSGHVLSDGEVGIWAIDHGLCFHWQPKLRTVVWDYSGDAIPEHLLIDLNRAADDLPDAVGRHLERRERAALLSRISAMIDCATFPEPVEGDRPPYPWPLV
ncbi:MAG: SCO1664 family protein [Acidimicrobiales bacterium]